MKPLFTGACLMAGIAVATTNANAQDDVASETARSVINGIILGGKVGPDFYGFVPANIQSRVMVACNLLSQLPADQDKALQVIGRVCDLIRWRQTGTITPPPLTLIQGGTP
jgi:hypothetical protein